MNEVIKPRNEYVIERSSNIELFRIVLMIMLVASHHVHNSGILEQIYLHEDLQIKTCFNGNIRDVG